MCVLVIAEVFFFKQKTAYEMRISDWSSDVCSSDLDHRYLRAGYRPRHRPGAGPEQVATGHANAAAGGPAAGHPGRQVQANFMLVVGLVSEDGSMSNFDLSDYIVSNIQDPISRTQGVGAFLVFGSATALRTGVVPD